MGVTEWDIGLGEKRTRTEIKEQCGGSKYSGIETGPEDMMIYTDPIEGPRFGYIDRFLKSSSEKITARLYARWVAAWPRLWVCVLPCVAIPLESLERV